MSMRPKKLIGLIMFSAASGMVFSILLPNNFLSLMMAAVLLLCGYNLFCGC